MRRLMTAVACLATATAFAQEDVVEETTTVQLPGVNVKVKTQRLGDAPAPGAPAPAPARAQPPPRTFGGDAFSIDYSPMGVPSTTIKVVSPEGATAEVWSEDGEVSRFSVPFNFSGRGDTYYRFILTGADGALLLDKKFETKRFLGGTLKMKGAAAPASPAPSSAPGMSEADFDALVAAVNDAGFGNEKLGVIETAAQSHSFTVEQVGKLVDLLGSSDEKVGVVERTRRKIVDRQNGFKLLEHFSFTAEKEKVRKLLK